MIRIGLLWHSFSSGNLGVGALSIAHVELLRQACEAAGLEPSFAVFGTRGAAGYDQIVRGADHHEVTFRHLVAEPATRRNLREAFRACDIVFDIGEGDSFTDIYGWKRFAALALSKHLVLRSGTPLVLAPQTIGPFRHPLLRRAANALIRRTTATFPRDRLSAAYLEEQGLAVPGGEAIDLAFRLPHEPRAHGGDAVHVGINVSGLLYNGGYTGRNQFALTLPYDRLVESLIEAFADRPGVQVHLVAHVSGANEVEDDHRAARALGARYPAARVAPRFPDPVAAKSYIAGLDFFTGARMHSTIAAFSSGVPVVPVAYSRKFQGLFGTLGYPHVVDATSATLEQARGRILEGFEARAELAALVAAGNRLAQERLRAYGDFVQRLLEERRGER